MRRTTFPRVSPGWWLCETSRLISSSVRSKELSWLETLGIIANQKPSTQKLKWLGNPHAKRLPSCAALLLGHKVARERALKILLEAAAPARIPNSPPSKSRAIDFQLGARLPFLQASRACYASGSYSRRRVLSSSVV